MLARLPKRVIPCGHGDYVSQVALPSADRATQRLLKRPAPRVSQERADQPLFPGVGWHRLNTLRLYGFKLVGGNAMREMGKAIEKGAVPTVRRSPIGKHMIGVRRMLTRPGLLLSMRGTCDKP